MSTALSLLIIAGCVQALWALDNDRRAEARTPAPKQSRQR